MQPLVLDYFAGHWAQALASPPLDSEHSEPEVLSLFLSPDLAMTALLLSSLISSPLPVLLIRNSLLHPELASESSWVAFYHMEPT